MSNSLLYRIEKYIILLLIPIELAGLIFHASQQMLLCILITPIYLIGFYFAYTNSLMSLHILTLYYTFVGPIQLVLSQIAPGMIIIKDPSLLSNAAVIEHYFVITTVSYLIMLVVSIATKYKSYSFHKINARIRILSGKNYFIKAVIFAVVVYYLRITFKINVPGYVPTIRFAGIIVYGTQALGFYYVFLSCIKELSNNRNRLGIKNYLKIAIVVLFTHLPDILIGERGPVLTTVLSVALFLIIVMYDTNSGDRVRRISTVSVLAIFGLLLLVYGITNYFRFDEFSVIGNFMGRITGVSQGVRISNDYLTNGIPSNLGQFFLSFINDNGLSPNQYYTYYVLHFPLTARHSSAIPFSTACYYYGGYVGVIVITGLFTILYNGIYRSLNRSVIQFRANQEVSLEQSGWVFCCCILLFKILSIMIDGNILMWKGIVPALLFYMLVKMTYSKSEVFLKQHLLNRGNDER